MDVWYPIQVKQKDRVGRPDIDSFEAVMTRGDQSPSGSEWASAIWTAPTTPCAKSTPSSARAAR